MSPAIDVPPRPADPYSDPIALAFVDVVAAKGYKATTVAAVCERAGVSRTEFDRRFAGKEDCALKVFDAFSGELEWRIGTAFASQPDWRSGLRMAAFTAVDWMVRWPNLVRFGAVEVLQMESEMARVRREGLFTFCAGLVERGRADAPDPAAIPDNAALVATGSIARPLAFWVQSGAKIIPRKNVREMLYAAVRLYRGEQVAREELTMQRPQPLDFEKLALEAQKHGDT